MAHKIRGMKAASARIYKASGSQKKENLEASVPTMAVVDPSMRQGISPQSLLRQGHVAHVIIAHLGMSFPWLAIANSFAKSGEPTTGSVASF